MDNNEYLILVDENDQPQGKMEKLEVHQKGKLHRAFSVFLFNSKGELLLQQRAAEKYHSPGLWSNTCCSHPRYGEALEDAVDRRLKEELGIFTQTKLAFSFIYKIHFDNGLTEHELDHVFTGVTDDIPAPNPAEVKAWKYMSIEELQHDLKENPQLYTGWFKICFNEVINKLNENGL